MEGWTGDRLPHGEDEPILADIAHIPYDVPFDGVKTFRKMFEGSFATEDGPAILIAVPTRQQADDLQREHARRKNVWVRSFFQAVTGYRADIVIAAPIPDFWREDEKERAEAVLRRNFKHRLTRNGLFIQL